MNKKFVEKRRLGAKSIQFKIMLWSGISFLVSAALIIGYAAFAFRTAAVRAAEEKALDVAHAQAAEIRTALESTLSASETIAQSVSIVKTEGVQLSRDQVNAMLRQMLRANPQFLGDYVLYEPNAFDGRDAEFINSAGSDANGRFLPYWTRGDTEKIQVELLQDYDISDWYQCPKTTKVPCLIDPYVYPVQGKDVLMTSLVVPLVVNEKFLGITGIDTRVTFLQEMADTADIYDGAGKVVIISNNGTLLGVTGHPELIGQPVTAFLDHFSTEDYQAVKEGKEFMRYRLEGGQLEVFAPIQVGDTAAPWSVNEIIPEAVILAEASRQMWSMIAIGAGLLLVSLVALFFAARQIARPIRKVTDVALQVADGNLNVLAEVQSSDETGILASTFNQMTEQLRTAFTTLEERVAARTRDLETVAEVGTTTATILESRKLLQEVVDLTKERFGLYHAHIYLLDDEGQNLVLAAGAGEPGRIMVAEGHSIPLDREQSLVARAARERKGVTVNDVTQSPDFLANRLLPDTRSEMAVPMIVGENVIGVLDTQSDMVGRFTDADVSVGTTLASLVATSIQNVRTFEQSQKQAQFESLVNAISQKIQRATSIEETLKIGIREVGLALGAPEVSASLSRCEDSNSLLGSN
jgi:putative methionine-R-sulfoxide reductase with GAF domain